MHINQVEREAKQKRNLIMQPWAGLYLAADGSSTPSILQISEYQAVDEELPFMFQVLITSLLDEHILFQEKHFPRLLCVLREVEKRQIFEPENQAFLELLSSMNVA